LSAPQRKRFSNVLGGGQVEKRVFTRFLTVIMASHTFFNPPSPINNLHLLKNSYTFFFLLFLSSTTMCFHRWPFIERGIFGNPSGVI